MPIFEYQCPACGEKVEKIERHPSEEIPCPRCGKPARRTVSVFSGSSTGGGCAAPSGSGFG